MIVNTFIPSHLNVRFKWYHRMHARAKWQGAVRKPLSLWYHLVREQRQVEPLWSMQSFIPVPSLLAHMHAHCHACTARLLLAHHGMVPRPPPPTTTTHHTPHHTHHTHTLA